MLHKKAKVFHNQVDLITGSGNRVHFWDDVWLGDSPLESLFSRFAQGGNK